MSTTSANLSALLSDIRTLADKAKASALAATKASNADLPTGHKLPSLVIANHAKASATVTASASLIAALQSGSLVVKGAGKVLKSGDASIRIGLPLADLKTVVKQAQDKSLASADKRTVARFRAAFPNETVGKDDTLVLKAARMHAERVAAEKAAAKAAKDAAAANVVPMTDAKPMSEVDRLLAGLAA